MDADIEGVVSWTVFTFQVNAQAGQSVSSVMPDLRLSESICGFKDDPGHIRIHSGGVAG
jgi:hypothetical protein